MSTTIMAFVVGFILTSGVLILKIVEKMVLTERNRNSTRILKDYVVENPEVIATMSFLEVPSVSSDEAFRMST